MLGIRVQVDGARLVARLDRAGRRVADPRPGLQRAGWYMLLQLWERITERPVQAYSGRYLAWLAANGELSGKLWGILTGDLLGQSAPLEGAPQGALGAEVESDAPAVTVGHLNPASERKARGFAAKYQRTWGEWPYSPRPGDEERVAEVLDDWLGEAVSGRGV
jgi:hypothetical protein